MLILKKCETHIFPLVAFRPISTRSTSQHESVGHLLLTAIQRLHAKINLILQLFKVSYTFNDKAKCLKIEPRQIMDQTTNRKKSLKDTNS